MQFWELSFKTHNDAIAGKGPKAHSTKNLALRHQYVKYCHALRQLCGSSMWESLFQVLCCTGHEIVYILLKD